MKRFISEQPISTDLGLLLLRLIAGGAMLTHGFSKFLKVLNGDLQFGDPVGLGQEVSLLLVVFAEFICSILLIIGLGTRLALIPLIITMAVAFFVVHGADEFGAREMPFLYLGIYISIFFTGPGKYAADRILFNKEVQTSSKESWA